MFRDSIDRIIKVRRYIDKQCALLIDQPFLCARLEDVSFQLTIVIKDLNIIEKALDKEKDNEKENATK